MTFIFGTVISAVALVAGVRVVKLAFKAINKLFDKLDDKL